MISFPRSLIPDANILFSFFKSDSTRRHVFRDLLKHDVKFFDPRLIIEEILSEKGKIKRFSYINESEFLYLFNLLDKQIEKSNKDEFEKSITEARDIAPHEKDIPYFALALSLNMPIWSDEKAFKKQSKVKVLSTKDLLNLLSSTNSL